MLAAKRTLESAVRKLAAAAPHGTPRPNLDD
jgi:hypothetical protein